MGSNAKRFDRWIRSYVRAWRTDDADAIGALFSPRALYSTGPFDRLWRGRARIVAEWVARGDSKLKWSFRHKIVAADGATGVIEGRTIYAASKVRPRRVYGNLWIVRLNARGEADEFREWFMPKPK